MPPISRFPESAATQMPLCNPRNSLVERRQDRFDESLEWFGNEKCVTASLSNLCVRFIIHKAFDCNPSECSNKDEWFKNLCRWSYIDLSIKNFYFSYERKRFSIHVEKSKSPKINTKIIVARENHNLRLSYCCNCIWFFPSLRSIAQKQKLRIEPITSGCVLNLFFTLGALVGRHSLGN